MTQTYLNTVNILVKEDNKIVGSIHLESNESYFGVVNVTHLRFHKQLKNGFLVVKRNLPLSDLVTNYTI